MNVPTHEVDFSNLSIVDSARVLRWKGRVFRKIDADAEDDVTRLIECGLVQELVSKGLLVRSEISPLRMDDGSMLIEHELVPVTTYPREWSFGMVKDAARLVLEVNEVACRYGYQTKDCNGYNVLFRNGAPIFVDLGSFVPAVKHEDSLFSYEEFLLSYLHPLRIWSSAGHSLGSRCLPRAGGVLLPVESYARFRWPFLRSLRDHHISYSFKVMCSLRTLRHNDLSRIRAGTPRAVAMLVRIAKKFGIFRGAARFGALRKRIERLRHSSGSTLWSDYHRPYVGMEGYNVTDRFKYIIDLIVESCPRSVLEIGGNQGVISRLAKIASPLTQVVCTDPDAVAIDKGRSAAVRNGENIHWAVLNPFASESSTLEVSPQDRFRSEVVVAMALTHHLVLTQGFRIDHILNVIASYATKTVFIEFMPLGLHDGKHGFAPPRWYNEQWFEQAFRSRFDMVSRVQLESNRILYTGNVGGNAAASGS